MLMCFCVCFRFAVVYGFELYLSKESATMDRDAKATPVEKFGKDHWSLLAYVESCCVDGTNGRGHLRRDRMRCNPKSHRLMAGPYSSSDLWIQRHSTRLAGFFDSPDRNDPEKAIAAGLQLRDHDDWDCLDDLEAAGFIEVRSIVNGYVTMTPKGCDVAAKLRAHKAGGGHFTDFSLAKTGEAGAPDAPGGQPLPPEAEDKNIDTCDVPELTAAYFGDAIFNRAGEDLIATVQAARSSPQPASDSFTEQLGAPGADLDSAPPRPSARGA